MMAAETIGGAPFGSVADCRRLAHADPQIPTTCLGCRDLLIEAGQPQLRELQFEEHELRSEEWARSRVASSSILGDILILPGGLRESLDLASAQAYLPPCARADQVPARRDHPIEETMGSTRYGSASPMNAIGAASPQTIEIDRAGGSGVELVVAPH